MFLKFVKFNFVLASFTLSSAPFVSHANEVESLLDLPLDELFYVASKSYDKFEDAPGVVSVIRKSQIERFGAKNLADVLNYATSFQLTSKLFFRNSTSSVRSANKRMLDGHILILINGRPIRDNIAGSVNSPIYSGFPIDIIDHIEVVRGPGSVLYGSNAFTAVVNIVTDKPKSNGVRSNVKLTRGSYVSRGAEVNVSYKDDEFDLLVAGKHYESDGWNYRANNISGDEVSTKLYERDQAGYGMLTYGDFTFQGFQSKRKDDHINAFVTSPAFVTFENTRTFADMGYKFEINDDYRLDVNFTYNSLTSGDIYGFESDGNSYLFENNLYGKLVDDLDVLLGWTAEYREAKNKTITSAYSRDFSWFAQASYKPNEKSKFIIGVQANRPDIGSWDYSPRLAYNYKFDDDWGMKLSYGKAFRTPSFLEKYSTTIGVESLNPEVIRSYDFQLYYRNPKTYAALSLYNMRQENSIGGSGAGAPYENGESLTHRGIEFEATHYLSDEHYVEGSFTWQRSLDKNSVEGWGWSPSFMSKLGYSYTPLHDLYDLGLYAHYYSDATRVDDINSNYKSINKNPDSYVWLTAKSKVNLNKMWKTSYEDLYVEFFAENLLDEEVYSTTVTLSSYNSNLSRPGRTLFANLRISF